MLIGQPCPLNMPYCMLSKSVAGPVDPKIVRQVSMTVLEWKEFAPTKYIAVCIVLMVGRIGPGANHDLGDRVPAVHPEKVVHRSLSVWQRLHP